MSQGAQLLSELGEMRVLQKEGYQSWHDITEVLLQEKTWKGPSCSRSATNLQYTAVSIISWF